jgi:DNA-binding transcriptional MerR regulator
MALQQIALFAFDEEPVVKPAVTAGEKPEPKAVVPEKPILQKPEPEQIKVKSDNKKPTRGRVSLKEKESGADLIEIPEDAVLFEKKYYAIGIVANMFKVNQSLLRYWENEFDILKPRKNGKGDRLFRPEDIKNLKLIYHLLRERKYTLEGAKDFLKQNKRADEKFALIESLKKLKGFLHELKADL